MGKGLSRGAGRSAGLVGGGCLAAEDLEHDRAAGRATAFDRLPAVLHRLFHGIDDFFPGLALDAVTFRHSTPPVGRASCVARGLGRLRGPTNQRQLGSPYFVDG